MTPELSRTIDTRHLPEGPVRIVADAAQRAALAERFAIEAIERLEADVGLAREGAAILASGRLQAALVQACAVSGEPFAVQVDAPVALRFVAQAADQPEEIDAELDSDEPDEITYTGTKFDLGEAIAQTLALAIDPYAEGPEAEAVRRDVGLDEPAASGPFAALAAWKN